MYTYDTYVYVYMCMCVCVCVCVYVCVCVCVCVYLAGVNTDGLEPRGIGIHVLEVAKRHHLAPLLHICKYAYIHPNGLIRTQYICTYVCIIRMYVYTYVFTYVCVCMYVCTYV